MTAMPSSPPGEPIAITANSHASPITHHSSLVMSLPDLSVVILNYNAAADLRRCLRALPAACAGLAYEPIVVDNASPRPGIERIAAGFPDVRLIRRRVNGGFSVGYNTGIRAARAPYVLILNPDTEPEPASAGTLLAHALAHPEIGVLGPRLVNEDGTLQLSCRRYPDLWTALFNRHSLLTRLLPANRRSAAYLMSDWDHTTVADVDWLSGAAMLLRRDRFLELGGFDEGYFFTMEDVDLCRRMHAAGARVVYDPHATVMHRIGGSARTAPGRVILARHRGMWRYYQSYLRGGVLRDTAVAAGIAARCAALLAVVQGRRLIARNLLPRSSGGGTDAGHDGRTSDCNRGPRCGPEDTMTTDDSIFIENPHAFAEEIRELRTGLGLTEEEYAQQAGITVAYVQQVDTGEVDRVPLDAFLGMARVLDRDPERLGVGIWRRIEQVEDQ